MFCDNPDPSARFPRGEFKPHIHVRPFTMTASSLISRFVILSSRVAVQSCTNDCSKQVVGQYLFARRIVMESANSTGNKMVRNCSTATRLMEGWVRNVTLT